MTDEKRHGNVRPQPRSGFALMAVAFGAWALSLVLYPTPDTPTAGSQFGQGMALTGLFLGPALVVLGAQIALGVRTERWGTGPAWLVWPIVAAMLILAIGAAATDAPRSAVAVGALALLALLVGFLGAARHGAGPSLPGQSS